jgi:hypothetical protein
MRPGSALAVLALLVPALGCAPSDPSPGEDEVALEACPATRPQMCTKEYRPVCGHLCANPPCESAERRTYGNACDACAHAEVVALAPGRCEGGAPEKPPSLR